MADTGWKSPAAVATVPRVGAVDWSDPTNVYTSNNQYATASFSAFIGHTYYLDATDFTMGVPAGATINGVNVEVEKSASAKGVSDETVQLIKRGTAQGENKAIPLDYPASDAYISYGGSTDMWELSLPVEDINASNFGLRFAVQGANGTNVSIDHIRIKVYYTEAPPVRVPRPTVAVGNPLMF